MKKILVTGLNSYVGTAFINWMSQWKTGYIVETIDLKDVNWKNKNFSEYDVIFHVAGIAHVDINSVSNETKELYYKINRDLTVETAAKAKSEGVKQFIFMSSIIVYGENKSLKEERIITKETPPAPTNFYGDSKLQAEYGILPMQSDDFRIVVLRPPMIYGKNSKGNYKRLSKLAQNTVVFPKIKNQRSMLHIDHLCEFVRLMIENEESGTFFPQNEEYACTSDMVKMISEIHNKKLVLTSLFNPIIKILPFDLITKVFGTLAYDKEISRYKNQYNLYSFRDSLRQTEL